MDLDDLERKITPKTKVIMVVHWGGYPIDLDRIKKIQQKTKELYGFEPIVIEDCAHGIGSKYKGKRLGNHGNLCMFSFQAIKHITAVDGGSTQALGATYESLYVGVGGDVVVTMVGTGNFTFSNVASGQLLPIRITHVIHTNTTATNMIALKA